MKKVLLILSVLFILGACNNNVLEDKNVENDKLGDDTVAIEDYLSSFKTVIDGENPTSIYGGKIAGESNKITHTSTFKGQIVNSNVNLAVRSLGDSINGFNPSVENITIPLHTNETIVNPVIRMNDLFNLEAKDCELDSENSLLKCDYRVINDFNVSENEYKSKMGFYSFEFDINGNLKNFWYNLVTFFHYETIEDADLDSAVVLMDSTSNVEFEFDNSEELDLIEKELKNSINDKRNIKLDDFESIYIYGLQ